MLAEFDNTKIVPGVLCRRGHNSTGDGRSLRYVSGGQCIECSRLNRESNREKRREWLKEYNALNREKLREQRKERYYADREGNIAKVREYYIQNKSKVQEYKKKYSLKNKEKIAEYKREYSKKNAHAIREHKRIYQERNREQIRETKRRCHLKNPESKRASERRRRANKRNAHKAPYTMEQFKTQWDLFSNCCAYCGSTEKPNVDHFIPLHKGGSETLSNLIPACQRCNFSKNDSDPFEWYKKQPFFSRKRWRFILKVLGKTEANYSQIPLF